MAPDNFFCHRVNTPNKLYHTTRSEANLKYAPTIQQAFRWLSPLLCVILGSPAIIVLPLLLPRISLVGAGLIVGSALSYGGAAYIYARCRPDLFPGIFGYHELFHLLTILGAAATTAVVWIWIM